MAAASVRCCTAMQRNKREEEALVYVTLGHEMGLDFGCDLVLNNAGRQRSLKQRLKRLKETLIVGKLFRFRSNNLSNNPRL